MKHLIEVIDSSSLPLDVKLELRVMAAMTQFCEDVNAIPCRSTVLAACRRHGLDVENMTDVQPRATPHWLRDILFTSSDQDMTIRELRQRLFDMEQQDAPISSLG